MNWTTWGLLVCLQGLKAITKLLLRRLADINAKNHAGNTPLHYAFEYNFKELGDYLISKGADPTMQNGQGLTCYEGLTMDDLDALDSLEIDNPVANYAASGSYGPDAIGDEV